MGGHPQPDSRIKHALSLLEQILVRVHQECISGVCEDSGCGLSLQGLDPTTYALLAMDCPHLPQLRTVSRCDFLFLGWLPGSDRFWVGPIELTLGHRKTWIEIRDQLAAGGLLAEKLLPVDQDVQFAPVAAGPFKKFKEDKIRRQRIPFRKRTFFPAAVNCGSDLLTALRTAVGS